MSYRGGISGIVGEAYFPQAGSTTLPPSYAVMPTLWVQQALKWEASQSGGRIRDPGTIDGAYGPQTRASLNDYVNDVQPNASFQLWVFGTGRTSTLGMLDDFQRALTASRYQYLRSLESRQTSTPSVTSTAPEPESRPSGSTFIGPHLDPATDAATAPASRSEWVVPTLVVGGTLLVLVGGYLMYRGAKPRRLALATNRRRRRGR